MDALQPSRTAQGAAMHRAAHQLLDIPPVFADPLAVAVIGAEAAAMLREGSWEGANGSGLRAFIAARSRLAEDTLKDALGRGVRQYVLLGAGLDTFAYRSGEEGVRVFEIDHPATQAWKRARLAEAGIGIPGHVIFAPVDFETETLAEGLALAQFDFAKPAVFAWLGVTPYLSEETVLSTLHFIASNMQPESAIVFDYAEPRENHEPEQRESFNAMAERVAALGEPFLSFFEPARLAQALQTMGFSRAEDFDTETLNARYFEGRGDGLKLRGRGHLMIARI